MNKTLIFFIVMVCVLFPQAIPVANAQQGSTNPPAERAEEGASEATRKELLAFYDKIKSINEDCRLKRETLKIALSEEAKKVLEDRQEERHAEEKNK
jgi:hypothetical protein